MAPSSDRYALRGGKWGHDRLAILARDRWPDTLSFLSAVGIAPGMRCIDVGCGGGAVTVEMAKLVGPGGIVVGIDRDGVKLELARSSAQTLHLENVEFRQLALADWTEVDAYDLVYSRFLLQHLSAPEQSLRGMWRAVRPGGALAVEDVDHEGWSSAPRSSGIDFLKTALKLAIGAYGGDASVGRRLQALFIEAGISDPKSRKLERKPFSTDDMILAPLTLESLHDALSEVNPQAAAGYSEALKSLKELAGDPKARIEGPTLYQVHARKKLREGKDSASLAISDRG